MRAGTERGCRQEGGSLPADRSVANRVPDWDAGRWSAVLASRRSVLCWSRAAVAAAIRLSWG